MNSAQRPGKQPGFADLRQQIANQVCSTAVPADERGKLPTIKAVPIQRSILHLKKEKKA